MNASEARCLLLANGLGTNDDEDSPGFREEGFLGRLRPYRGLDENLFHEIMEALFVVGDDLRAGAHVDRRLVGSVWSMCSYARRWGVNPQGMLRRNRLISEVDVSRLEQWIDLIESTTLSFLSGNEMRDVIAGYAQYLCDTGAGLNAANFVPIMAAALRVEDDLHDPSTVAEALGQLGRIARPALPELHAAASRIYRLVHPVEQFTAEVRSTIHAAIEKIESDG